jgi:ectoine hydroxylase-related dioxygenase (phytanoyl-CoA dioxygenase family)
MTTATATHDLDTEYKITPAHTAQFKRDGFIKLKNVLSPETLKAYGDEITASVKRLNTETRPISERTTYGKAFLQIMNIWTKNEVVKQFVFGKRLARLAAELMGVKGVRLYHDQALYKEPSGGITPWHADQFYWPLSNGNTCTAWIPLQATPMNMGPLAFSVGSHKLTIGRDLEISDESEQKVSKALLEQKLPLDEGAFDLGEVSFHYGWTFHRAGVNSSASARAVMTIIYMEDGIKVAQPRNKNQQNDWDTWLPGAKLNEVVDTPLNPVLYRA